VNLLVATDLHYACRAPRSPHEARLGHFGVVLLRKALQRLRREGVTPDLVVLLGDLLDNGAAAGAGEDLATVAKACREMGIPVLAVPGNHDGALGNAEPFAAEGLHEFGGYGFWVFRDDVAAGDVTTRPAASLAAFAETAVRRSDLPLVALQHNPVYPPIVDAYPYMLTNGADVLAAYRRAGVVLSLSGHYHASQPLSRDAGFTSYTAPALCEAPFRFAHVRLEGRTAAVTEQALRLDVPGLVDCHCHTEYAYCGTGVNAADDVALSEALGLGGLCLTEHAFQLYFDGPQAWSWRWIADDAMVAAAWADPRRSRMQEFRERSRGWRSGFTRVGVETEVRHDGRLFLAPPDRAGWDVVIGSIHAMPGYEAGRTSQAEAERIFLRELQRLLREPISILAHPFRFFRREKLVVPRHLYRPVAAMLHDQGVAAEINFHTNEPDPEFFAECAARRVRIALGTDSHDLVEVGELTPHLRVLAQAGVTPERFEQVLWRPGGGG
jgi:histidinol phosphatase-like PHP family hydrolase